MRETQKLMAETTLEPIRNRAAGETSCEFRGSELACTVEAAVLCASVVERTYQRERHVERRMSPNSKLTSALLGVGAAAGVGFGAWVAAAPDGLQSLAERPSAQAPGTTTVIRTGGLMSVGLFGAVLTGVILDVARATDTVEDAGTTREITRSRNEPCGREPVSGVAIVLRTHDGVVHEGRTDERGLATFPILGSPGLPADREAPWGRVSAGGSKESLAVVPPRKLFADAIDQAPTIEQLERFRDRFPSSEEWAALAPTLKGLVAQRRAKEEKEAADRRAREEKEAADQRIRDARTNLEREIDERGMCITCDYDLLEALRAATSVASERGEVELSTKLKAKTREVERRRVQADVEAHLLSTLESDRAASLLADGIGAEVEVRGSSLRAVVAGSTHDDGALVAAVLSLTWAALGKGQLSKSAVLDNDLLHLAIRAAMRTAEVLRGHAAVQKAEPNAARSGVQDLGKCTLATYGEIGEGIRDVRITVVLVQPQQGIDEYARRYDKPPRLLRSGELRLSRKRLLTNDWESVADLASGGPVQHERATAAVRRYSDSWRTW